MDDPDCDSTWEEDAEDAEGDAGRQRAGAEADGDADGDDDDDELRAARPGALQARMQGTRNWRAMQDMRRYRHHYPDLVERDCNGDMPNLSFYRNEIQFLPNGCFIEEILQDWRDDYDLLEDNHSYIQWLFPLREPGVNWHAKPLTLKEIEAFKSCPEAMERFVLAYELMLGFYGVELEDRGTGAVRRAHNYQKRFQNLNWHSHNNLRITRILKSLGELGLERYQAPLAHFFLEETLVHRQLPAVRQSTLDYFVFAVRCRHQRRKLLHFAWEHFQPRCKFVWAPHDKLLRLQSRSPPHQPRSHLYEAGAQGRTCGPGGDSVPQEVESPKGDPGDAASEVDACGVWGPEPSSPKESKKRKLEVNQREQAPGEPGLQSSSEVEKIALNLEGCALSQGSLRVGAQDPEEGEQPCPQPMGSKVVDEIRKRRKVDEGTAAGGEAQTLAATWHPAALEGPEAGEGKSEMSEEAEGRAGEEQSTPRSPTEGSAQATTRPPVDEGAATKAGPSATPTEP
ncbi:opioid growth factor receptor [Elephas maximus indicus]|uniref:opioid growth factor receptor n=1 Tax=Elephas maximus indicus TaxID=99487 RepID=UPI0021163593|nr:opioid growth factor receptor [Elephas maximus indicus]